MSVPPPTKEIATRMESWAEANSDCNAYPNEPHNYVQAFPLAVAKIERDEERTLDTNHPESGYQQVHVQIYTVRLTVLVNPDPAWTSDQQLYDIMDDLKTALRKDQTLGGRVEDASRVYRIDYDGEAQTADGTRANAASIMITLGWKVPA